MISNIMPKIGKDKISIRDIAAHCYEYIKYIAINFKVFYLVLLLTLVALVLEYMATSLMIPLATNQTNEKSVLMQIWKGIAESVGYNASPATWLWIFFIVMAIRLIIGYSLTVLTSWLGKRVHETFSEKIFNHILISEPIGKIYARSVGSYITMAGDDTFKSGTIVNCILQVSVGLLTSVVGLVVLYQFSTAWFIGTMQFLLIISITTGYFLRRIVAINFDALQLSHEFSTVFLESLHSIRSVRSMHGERFLIDLYKSQIYTYVRLLLKIDAIRVGIRTFPALLMLLVAIVVLRPGTESVMTNIELFAGTIILTRIFVSLGQMATYALQMITDIRAVKDINTIVGIVNSNDYFEEDKSQQKVNKIELRNVTFGYSIEDKLLDNISFIFEAGRTYAIVGESGSGKSTLADLLLGFSLPNEGSIIVNDRDQKITGTHNGIVLVEQQPKIFSTTIRENLLLGLNIRNENILHALEIVSLSELINDLPDGIYTLLAYLGENFSGGQRQRLGIARALLRKPDVLILDEATSALDPITRLEVVRKLRIEMNTAIIIFITHDQEIAQLADEILLIGK